jgi:hypothetical protein
MKRTIAVAALALAAALTTSATMARAESYFGFTIGVTNAPAHRFAYAPPPDLYYEPSSRVYVVENGYDDWDVFRYGSTWYACDGDYWYRANNYRGPFYACDVRSVPRPIFYVPQNRWRRYPRPLAMWHTNRGSYDAGYARTRVYDRGYDRGYHRDYNRDADRYDRRWTGRDNGDYHNNDGWRTNDRGDWRNNDRGNQPPGWDKGRKNGWNKGHGNGRGHGHDDRD